MVEPLYLLLVGGDLTVARRLEEGLRGGPSVGVVERVEGLEAIPARLERGSVDLILLGLSPSDPHPIETVGRALAAAPQVPIVVLTGEENEAQGLQAMHAGAADYLVKEQVTPALLARSIRYAIARKRLELEHLHLLSTSAEMNERLILTSLREQEARSIAETAVRTRDQVLHVFAHDIANHLAVILINADQLLGALPQAPSRPRESASAIKRLAGELQELRKSILDAAQIEAGRLSLSLQMQRPRELLNSVCETLIPLAREKGVALEVAPGPELPAVRADRTRILEALGNLLGNALKFTPPGGTISLHGDTVGREVRLWVADTGAGIASDDLELIFESFWKKRAANPGGVGLGLTIAREIVEHHGGRIGVESELGRGTVVTLSLPVAEIDDLPLSAAAIRPSTRTEPGRAASPTSRPRGRENQGGSNR